MIRSMTGFGRGMQMRDGLSVTVEIRSVNHRYFEYSSRLPRAYAFLDDKLKKYIQQRVSRGKVDVSLLVETLESTNEEVSVNHALVESYLKALHEMAVTYGVREDISVMSLSRIPDVLTVHQTAMDEEAVWEIVQEAAGEAMSNFVAMRESEGVRLRDDVLSRGDTILSAVSFIEERSPQTVREHMEKVEARMRELLNGVPVDESRLLTEAAAYADKIAVAEETVRLRSHIDQLRLFMDSPEPIGRKLDFLVQEMNREANTIGSKCNDLDLARTVVDIKAEIEKIREQIQNIE